MQVVPRSPARRSEALGSDDEDSIVEHLRDLGYVE
jgi:hypothetical protein